jgi:pyruvate-formate lyase-activating enzyme
VAARVRYALTNYGHRFISRLLRAGAVPARLGEPEVAACAAVLARTSVPVAGNEALAPLVPRGLLAAVDAATGDDELRLRYARNPLEHVERVVFEFTNVCNLDCQHCRNSNLEAVHERQPERLRRVVDAVVPLGVTRFDFIGGEVTLYGRGWLELVEYLRARGGDHAAVITSGWFLEQTDFLAAGRRYADDRAYFAELAARGVTHVVFSLDGVGPDHDRSRGVPGLYARVLAGFDRARAAGLQPRVSVVSDPRMTARGFVEWLADLADRIYGPWEAGPRARADRLLGDASNYASNLIDVGGAVQIRRRGAVAPEIPDAALRCKNFFRPHPTFRVKASGEVSLCPLVDGGDGYGNVHERDVVDIMNHMQDALVYRLHAEQRIAAYRPLLDPALFGAHVGHVCTLRTALNMLARLLDERGVATADAGALRAINREVAGKMGLLPRTIKHRANGHALPGR